MLKHLLDNELRKKPFDFKLLTYLEELGAQSQGTRDCP